MIISIDITALSFIFVCSVPRSHASMDFGNCRDNLRSSQSVLFIVFCAFAASRKLSQVTARDA